MLVLVHQNSVALFLRDGDGGDFLRQDARFLRCHRFHLAGQSHAVLGFTFYFVIGSDVLSGFGHGVHAVHVFH